MSKGASAPRKMARVAMRASLLGAVLAASILPDHLLNLVCRSGVVMDVDACCPATEGGELAAPGPSAWRDEACCSLRAVDLDRAVPDRPGQTAPLVRAAVLVPAAAPVPPPPARLVAHRPPPPPRGPPMAPLLLKSSFLL
jgi:hypothetical protein